ncbi:MAG: HAD-IA family hydrolase [Pseudomonadota bacterium]
MSDLALALFDVDGTLVDSQGHILASMEQAFRAHGLAQPTREEILNIVGLSLPLAMARLSPTADPITLSETYKEAYAELRQRGDERALSPLYPGIRELLDELQAVPELLIGVATGKSRRGLSGLIEAHGLTFLATTQVADDHPSKPHPSMVLTALLETGVEPARAVMIGDTTYDMQMGRAAGITTIGVTWGYHATSALSPSADHMAASAGELCETIKVALSL